MGRFIGTVSRGIRLPIVQSGEKNLDKIIVRCLDEASHECNTPFKNKDIICVTEALVARSEENYVTVDDIANDIIDKFGENPVVSVLYPIYSRNRFSLILKGIARAAKKIYLLLDDEKDEVGNDKVNPFTSVDIEQFYKELIEAEHCKVVFDKQKTYKNIIYCKCHFDESDLFEMTKNCTTEDSDMPIYTLTDICSTPSSEHGYNENYGLLGSNKATEEKIKLFPRHDACKKVCDSIQNYIKKEYDVTVEVMVYGDGCFKDPIGGIWEFADPVVSPYYTDGLKGTPNELKIKYIADNKQVNTEQMKEFIKQKDENLVGNMLSQGTTPRRYCDLVGSLADLTSGSGDKGTPVIWISGYFDNYATE